MKVRAQITLPPDLQSKARRKATELGISFAEYIRRVISKDLGGSERPVDVSAVFDLVTSGKPTSIARDKDKMIGEAVWQDHLRSTGPLRRRRPRAGQR